MYRKRAVFAVAVAAAMATVVAACSSGSSSTPTAGSSGSGSGATATMWLVTTGPSPADDAEKALVSSFEASHPGMKINLTLVENQSFKQKLQLAMGAGNPPTIFWTWGGGILQQYIKANYVEPLDQSLGAPFLPASLGAVTYQGKLYGIPVQGTQPVYFFYNKPIFDKYHLTFPTTWSGLLSTISTLKSHGVEPISLAAGDQWPSLMYLEYLTDRIGGPTVVQDLEANKAGAWSNPAIIQALTDIQQLVKAGAFNQGYQSLKFSGGGSDALVYSGKAAMQLMGDWDLSSTMGANKSFVTSGNMGMAPFPSVPGTGDPADLAGNTASYVAISSRATAAQKDVAKAFFKDSLASQDYAKAQVSAGEVPVTTGASGLFAGQDLESYDTTIYSDVQKAPNFQYSWDQALTPAPATALLTNLAQVFTLSMTPQGFASAMNKVAATGS